MATDGQCLLHPLKCLLSMLAHRAAQMAEEYFYAHNFAMAKRFYERVAKTYQKERWFHVLAHTQRCLRECSQQLGLLQEFVSTSVALLSSRLSSAPEAARALVGLLALVKVQPSDGLLAEAAKAPTTLITMTTVASSAGGAAPPPAPAPFPPLTSPISLDLDGTQSLLSCTAVWSMPSIVLGESATLEIALRSHLAGALDLNALRLSASDPSLSTTLSSLPPDASATTPATTLAAAAGAPLHLEAGGVMVVRFTYSPKVAAVVSLLSLSVQLGLEPCAIILSIPVVAPADEAAPDGTPTAPQISVTEPPPDLSLTLSHPPTLLNREATLTTLTLLTAADEVFEGTLSLTLAPATAPEGDEFQTADLASFPEAGGSTPAGLRVPFAPAPLTPLAGSTGGTPSAAIITSPGRPSRGGNVSATAAATSMVGIFSSPLPSPGSFGSRLDATPLLATPGAPTLLLPKLLTAEGKPLPSSLTLPRMAPSATHTVPVALCTYAPGKYTLLAVARYTTAGGKPTQEVSMSFDLLAAPAVSVQTSFVLTADQRQRGHLCRGEPVNVLVRVTSVAPPPASLRLHSVTMLPANYTDEAVGTDEATAAEAAAEGGARLSEAGAVPLLTIAEGTAAEVDAGGCEMREGSIFSCLFRLEPTRDVRATSLGHVHVRWVRALSEGSARGAVPGTIERMAEDVVALPPVDVRASEFELSYHLPTEGQLGAMLTLIVVVTNRTKEIRSLRLSFSENESCLFCGLKLYHFRLPPAFSQTLTFNVVPIKTGAVHLPMPRLLCVDTSAELIDASAQHRVFVRPAEPLPDLAFTQSAQVASGQVEQSA